MFIDAHIQQTHTHTHIIYIYIMYIYICTYMCIYMYIYMCVCVYVYIYIYMYRFTRSTYHVIASTHFGRICISYSSPTIFTLSCSKPQAIFRCIPAATMQTFATQPSVIPIARRCTMDLTSPLPSSGS